MFPPVFVAGRITAPRGAYTLPAGNALPAPGSRLQNASVRGYLHRRSPRAARLRRPIASNSIEAGDQLFLRGAPEAIGALVRRGRLLEIGRQAAPVKAGRPAALVIGIYAAAVLLAGTMVVGPGVSFDQGSTVSNP